MMRVSSIAAFLFASMMSGCGALDPTAPVELPMRHIKQDYWPPFKPEGDYVIRDDAEWDRVWALHEPETTPKTPQPNINFSRHMALGVSRGNGPNSDSSLSIQRVVRDGNKLRVEYMVDRNDSPGGSFHIAVSLTDFVRVPRTDGEVSFVEVELPQR